MGKAWQLRIDGPELLKALAELEPGALKVWLFVRYKAGEGETRLKQATIAAAVGMSARNVRRWLDSLVQRGWLATARTGKANIFRGRKCPLRPDVSAHPERTMPAGGSRMRAASPLPSLPSFQRFVRSVERQGERIVVTCSAPHWRERVAGNVTALRLLASRYGVERWCIQ